MCASSAARSAFASTAIPIVFLGYWRNEAATAAKVRDGWLHTGDQAEEDADGYLRFVGRDDDVITSSGYRIGPGEIEGASSAIPRSRWRP